MMMALGLQTTSKVQYKRISLLYILPEMQIKINFYGYHQYVQANKIIRVPPSMKVPMLSFFISIDNSSLGYFWKFENKIVS